MKSQHKQHIIFDLTGVLFCFSKLKQFRSIGLWQALMYVITHRKSPVGRFLDILQKLHELEPKNYPIMYYKKTPFPRCMSDFMCGYIDNQKTTTIINKHIEDLSKQNYFNSNFEIVLMQQIVQTIMDGTFALEPDWHVIELVKKLKENNYTLYILSNFDKESYKRLAHKHHDIFALFENIIISAHIHMLKPYKEIYDYMLTKYQLKAEQCLFIDDQKENIVGAQSVGINSLHYTNLKTLLKDFKNYHIITE